MKYHINLKISGTHLKEDIFVCYYGTDLDRSRVDCTVFRLIQSQTNLVLCLVFDSSKLVQRYIYELQAALILSRLIPYNPKLIWSCLDQFSNQMTGKTFQQLTSISKSSSNSRQVQDSLNLIKPKLVRDSIGLIQIRTNQSETNADKTRLF